jgi:GTP-binding protein YchF
VGFKCGIVGLPNVGKSSLFNALTRAAIAAENYPFCTIDPNVGIVPVVDPRLDRIADLVKPKAVVPTTVEFVDIAGLVAGASKGEGLGNQFLAHIRETQAIAHVVRCFEDDNVVHVAGRIDPLADIEVVETELALADLETCTRALERHAKLAKSGEKDAQTTVALLERVVAALNEVLPIRRLELDPQEHRQLAGLHLLTAKPCLFVANVAETELDGNDFVDQVRDYAQRSEAEYLVISAALEAELARLSAAEHDEFLHELGLQEPGLNAFIRAGYELLGLQTFFTAGPKECRAWTVARGATAAESAGVIHTDFERGFIRAEVIGYDDFIDNGGESGAQQAGRLRLEGKDYRVADGDVIHFRFNV